MNALVGGIEAGGTKFVCAVGTGPEDIRAEWRFPTTTPEATIDQAIRFLVEQQAAHGALAAVGIASFGPVDPNPRSRTFGYITTTPKPGWRDTDFAGRVQRALRVPVGLDTDVNVAAVGEARWGAAQGLDTFLYLTVGTGIGGGGLAGGQLLHGLIHPEMGHIRIPHDRQEDPYAGCCPFHGDCLEGLAAGPALEGRWGQPGRSLADDQPAWALEAKYLALALVNFICVLSPQRIILGGGVMDRGQLLPRIRRQVQQLLNGYVQAPQILDDVERFIVSPGLGHRAGVLGAIALAQQQLRGESG